MSVKLNERYLSGFLTKEEIDSYKSRAIVAHGQLLCGTGAGNDFCGWVNLPESYDKDEFARIKAAADKIKKKTREEIKIF